jgi:hypothetical protein
MLGILIRLNMDLFGHIRILQGTMAVRSAIFHARSQIGIRFVANPSDLSSLILYLWMHCSTDLALKQPIFKRKKGCEP